MIIHSQQGWIIKTGEMIILAISASLLSLFTLLWLLRDGDHRNLTDKTGLAQEFCEKMTEDYDESHNYEHHLRVLRNLQNIIESAENSGSRTESSTESGGESNTGWRIDDEEEVMLEVAALIHDTVDHKYSNDISEVRNFLLSIYDEDQTERILTWIQNMSWSKEKAKGFLDVPEEELIYTRLLADADRLDAIAITDNDIDWYGDFNPRGPDLTDEPIAVSRCRNYIKHKDPALSEEEVTERLIQHGRDKLFDLYEDIHTPWAKSLAEECCFYLKLYMVGYYSD